MYGLPEYTITPEMKFSDIIVPTMDTVRCSHVLEMLLTNNKTVRFILQDYLFYYKYAKRHLYLIIFHCVLQVLCVGPTGTGKTLAIADKLSRNMPKEYIPEFITFSAKTSANQTQDLIDGKLDKRYDANFIRIVRLEINFVINSGIG